MRRLLADHEADSLDVMLMAVSLRDQVSQVPDDQYSHAVTP
jgi:hypothetical protein